MFIVSKAGVIGAFPSANPRPRDPRQGEPQPHSPRPAPLGQHRPNLPDGVKPWKSVWSGGHSTGLISDVPSVQTVVDRLIKELAAARSPLDWRRALNAIG